MLGICSIAELLVEVFDWLPGFQRLKRALLAVIPKIDEECFVKAVDLIKSKGYIFEVHKILTEDSYILTAWRLRKSTTTKPYPVMLHHGLLDCSYSWFLNSETRLCFPYILAD
jgi:pimeloyl-ACP methyl ester carboxylesterase